MKRFLLLLAVVTTSFITATAQQEKTKENEFNVNLGYHFGLKKGYGGMFTLQPEYGRHFTEQLYVGVGSGLVTDDGFDNLAIPAFARVEVDFPNSGKLIPYVSLQGGYDFFVSGGSGTGYGRINPTVGIKVPVSRSSMFNIGFGYTRTIQKGGGCDYLGVNTGISFNSVGSWLRHWEKSLEIETMLPVSCTHREYDGLHYKEKANSFIGLRFSGIRETARNLYVGYTIGIGIYKQDAEFDDDTHNVDREGYNTTEPYGNIMARVRYKAKQITIADRIYPFVQVDAGACAFYDISFAVNPAVGVSMETVGGKHSVDITAGYSTVNLDAGSDDLKNKGTLRIAVGYTF